MDEFGSEYILFLHTIQEEASPGNALLNNAVIFTNQGIRANFTLAIMDETDK